MNKNNLLNIANQQLSIVSEIFKSILIKVQARLTRKRIITILSVLVVASLSILVFKSFTNYMYKKQSQRYVLFLSKQNEKDIDIEKLKYLFNHSWCDVKAIIGFKLALELSEKSNYKESTEIYHKISNSCCVKKILQDVANVKSASVYLSEYSDHEKAIKLLKKISKNSEYYTISQKKLTIAYILSKDFKNAKAVISKLESSSPNIDDDIYGLKNFLNEQENTAGK